MICIILVSFSAGAVLTWIPMIQKDAVYRDHEKILLQRIENLENNRDSDAYINLSLDDTILLFQDLQEHIGEYESIFDNSSLNFLQELHRLYGAKFVLYCYSETDDGAFHLSMLGSQYRKEFQEQSDWLRFGFHTVSGAKNYADADLETAAQDYQTVIRRLVEIVGEESIERTVRLQNFAGSSAAIQGMMDAPYGLQALLSADDERISYFLTEQENNELLKNRRFQWNGIPLIATDFRLENTESIMPWFQQEDPELIVFTHEGLLSSKDIREKLEECCRYAVEYGYRFSFVK